MAKKTFRSPKASKTESGANQNIGRATLVMSALGEAGANGLRLTDVVRVTGLGNATVHRVLVGLVTYGWAEQDPETGRFFLGMRLMAWGAMSSERFGFSRWIDPALVRLAQRTADTAYLMARVGDEAICVAQHEGAFPIKALTLRAGDRRPLGIGAGTLALLAFLPDDEVERILAEQAEQRARFAIDEPTLRGLIAKTRRLGHAFNDIHVIPGLGPIADMSAVAVPICHANGRPFAAISIAALSSRMEPPRRDNIIASIKHEVLQIEAKLRGEAPSEAPRRASAIDKV